jgi:hypothetical protein
VSEGFVNRVLITPKGKSLIATSLPPFLQSGKVNHLSDGATAQENDEVASHVQLSRRAETQKCMGKL